MRRHILLAGAGALAITVGTASAQRAMEDMDLDGDGRISAEEWDALGDNAEGKPYWSAYDADGSGGISEDEFRTGEFDRHDRNADSVLDAGEYQARSGGIEAIVGGERGEPDAEAAGMDPGQVELEAATVADAAAADATAMQGEAATAGLEIVDADGDTFLSREEFSASLEDETGPASFNAYDADADGNITGEEFLAGEFGRFDSDADGTLDAEEAGRATEGMTDG